MTMMAKDSNRPSWSGHVGFVMAAAASAIGLGNLWRFPSCAATFGGGVFLTIYILLAFFIGVPLLMTEIALGRATRLSPSKTYHSLNPRWTFVGVLGMVIPAIIILYYNVVGGWVLKYFIVSVCALFGGQSVGDVDFASWATSNIEPGICTLLFLVIVTVLILMGVRKGVEKSNRIMMPALLILVVFVAVYTLFQPSSRPGVAYYLVPDFSRLTVNGSFSFAMTGRTILSAMGQMFFSLSLAMGIMITYGSYVRKDDSIVKASARIAFFDTFVAFFAGLIVIPAAFSAGGAELAQKGGAGLMFASLPEIFLKMPFGSIVACAFFLLVLFAALTSEISITETVTSSVQDFTGWSRRKSALIVAALAIVGGIPNVISMDCLVACDFLANNILMPICAICTCIFSGWIVKPSFVARELHERTPLGFHFYAFIIRFVAPILIAVVFLAGLFNVA